MRCRKSYGKLEPQTNCHKASWQPGLRIAEPAWHGKGVACPRGCFQLGTVAAGHLRLLRVATVLSPRAENLCLSVESSGFKNWHLLKYLENSQPASCHSKQRPFSLL